MQNKWKHVALGALLGTAVSLALVAPNFIPKAWADDAVKIATAQKSQLMDIIAPKPAAFFKPLWTVEDSVSTDVLSVNKVRKIEGGRTSFVNVATTASGVYSSDALTSPNVRYPGIHAEGQAGITFALLVGGNWVNIAPIRNDSFVHVIPTENGGAIYSNGGSCQVIDGSLFC
jgi:hypothetical protein